MLKVTKEALYKGIEVAIAGKRIGDIGYEIQRYVESFGFNVVTADTLRKAQKKPEKYRDLIVRVAGYSDYFVDLGTDLQNEIILRSEQEI